MSELKTVSFFIYWFFFLFLSTTILCLCMIIIMITHAVTLTYNDWYCTRHKWGFKGSYISFFTTVWLFFFPSLASFALLNYVSKTYDLIIVGSVWQAHHAECVYNGLSTVHDIIQLECAYIQSLSFGPVKTMLCASLVFVGSSYCKPNCLLTWLDECHSIHSKDMIGTIAFYTTTCATISIGARWPQEQILYLKNLV